MQIVTDRGMDMAPEQMKGYEFHFAPLRITLDEKSYVSGVDIQHAEFYELLSKTESFPTTSQPSSGEFAALYRTLAKSDPDILSIHISSGLSGTINAARAGAEMVPEANVTIVDTLTLSCPMGWQVEAAARTLKAGWSLEQVLAQMAKIGAETLGIFTLSNLNYLIHGGRISHLKGLVASLLNIKPIIAVEKESGKYQSLAQEITLKRALSKMVELLDGMYDSTKPVRVQLLHGDNLPAIEILKPRMEQVFDCHWLPTVAVAPVLGAHTGPSLVGLAIAPLALFTDLP
ncbi:MAG: DegV family protein [Anaerolineaceae bacterium]|nr:DegV family protein [Anaerolineaceae bacterium]